MIRFNTTLLALSLMVYQTKAQKNQAQPTPSVTSTAYSLTQALEFAYKNSPSYLNAELDVQSSIYKKNEIRAAGLPQLSGSIDFKDFFIIPTSVAPSFDPTAPPNTYQPIQFGTQYNGTAGLSASQLLFSSDFIFGLKASKEFIHLSQINTLRTKAELASQVSKAYYTVVLNRERIKLMDANIIKLQKIVEDTKAMNKQGFVEQIDVDRLEVALNNLNTEEEKVNRLIMLAENLLKFQMGYQFSDPIILTDSLNIDIKNQESFNLSKIDVSNRPELQLLQAQQALYDVDLKRLKWGYMPTIAAYGSYQLNTYRVKADMITIDKTSAVRQWYKASLIGVTLNLNIFDGFQRSNKIKQAKITSQKNMNNLKNLQMASELEANVAGISYSNALSTVQSQKRNMDLAKNIYSVTQKKYEQGVGSNMEVINAQTSLKESETNYFNALFDMMVFKIDYLKATGTLVK